MKIALLALLLSVPAMAKDKGQTIYVHGMTESLKSWKVRQAMEHVALTNPKGKSKIVVQGEDGKTYTLSINGG